jgi:hypothetical protein
MPDVARRYAHMPLVRLAEEPAPSPGFRSPASAARRDLLCVVSATVEVSVQFSSEDVVHLVEGLKDSEHRNKGWQ